MGNDGTRLHDTIYLMSFYAGMERWKIQFGAENLRESIQDPLRLDFMAILGDDGIAVAKLH